MIETLTAAVIAELVFKTVIQTVVRKPTEAVLEKGKELWQKIRGKVKEEGVTEAFLLEVENKKSQEILEKEIVPKLEEAMSKDSKFAQEIQNIAQQINQEIEVDSQNNISMNATAHDQSTVKQVGEIKANNVQF